MASDNVGDFVSLCRSTSLGNCSLSLAINSFERIILAFLTPTRMNLFRVKPKWRCMDLAESVKFVA